MINYTNNQTVKFIMPLLIDISPSILINEYFIGAFIGDVDRPQHDGKLILTYHYPQTSAFAKLDAKLCRLESYVTSYDYSDKRITVYVFDIDENCKDSVEAVLDGKYSFMDPIDKLEVSKFWTSYTGSTLVESILGHDHTEVLKLWKGMAGDREDYCEEGEYWFKPDFVQEIFNIDEY